MQAASSLTELFPRLQAGEEEALERLVEITGRGVAAVLRHRTRSREEAEDLFQEVYRLAFSKIGDGEVREVEKLPAFLAGVARNLARDLRRKAVHSKPHDGGEVLGTLPSPEPDQLGKLLSREKGRLIREVLGELGTDRDRQVLVRYYLAEEGKEEICADLGLSSSHFNRVLFRARQRYKAAYLRRVGGTS
jgi:RNA polymerase sigma-70 factor (ECF subfamily)